MNVVVYKFFLVMIENLRKKAFEEAFYERVKWANLAGHSYKQDKTKCNYHTGRVFLRRRRRRCLSTCQLFACGLLPLRRLRQSPSKRISAGSDSWRRHFYCPSSI